MKKKTKYRLRLIGFFIVTFYIVGISSYAWTIADANIRPAQHEVCCGSPNDFGAEYESVTMRMTDGIQLSGWYIPTQNGATIILLHGYGGDRTGMLIQAEMLVSHGYGVLLYDQRASGESEGDLRSWGWQDVADVGAVLNFLETHPDVETGPVGVLGCSTGAEIAIGAGAQYEAIGAVVADGAFYAAASDTLPTYDFSDWITWPIYPIFLQSMEWKSGSSAPMPLKEAVALISPRSLLLIAAEKDGYEQFRAEQYYASAAEPKELWVVAGAGHCGGPIAQPEEYEKRIVDFFDGALLERSE